MFPERRRSVITAFQKANHEKKILPDWREFQIIKFADTIDLLVGDLNERYQAQRIDSLANTARNLFEVYIWVQFCNMSGENARRFFEDGVRDIREIMESLQKLYTSENQRPEDRLVETIHSLENAAAAHGITDYGERYVQVRDAAKEVGKLDPFSLFYKVFSKFAHPTSLLLALDHRVGQLSEMLDALYVGGENGATHSLDEIEKFIRAVYPGCEF